MPYVIKHKTKERYICGSKSNAAYQSMDKNDLVPIEYARVFPTLSGAKSALASWSHMLIEKSFLDYQLVRDHSKYDLMEIVEVKVKI